MTYVPGDDELSVVQTSSVELDQNIVIAEILWYWHVFLVVQGRLESILIRHYPSACHHERYSLAET